MTQNWYLIITYWFIRNHSHQKFWRKRIYNVLINNYILENVCVSWITDNLSEIETQSWQICQRVVLFVKTSTRVFYKLVILQKCRYCQLCFNCATRNEQDQKSILYSLTSNFQLTYMTRCIWRRKLQIHGNTKFTVAPILQILSFNGKWDYNSQYVTNLNLLLRCNWN